MENEINTVSLNCSCINKYCNTYKIRIYVSFKIIMRIKGTNVFEFRFFSERNLNLFNSPFHGGITFYRIERVSCIMHIILFIRRRNSLTLNV